LANGTPRALGSKRSFAANAGLLRLRGSGGSVYSTTNHTNHTNGVEMRRREAGQATLFVWFVWFVVIFQPARRMSIELAREGGKLAHYEVSG